MASEIIGKEKILRYLDKFDFQKIKLSRGTETIYIRRTKEGENQNDLIEDFSQWIDDFIEANNFKEYKIELFGSYSTEPGAKLSPIVKASVSFHNKPSTMDGLSPMARPSHSSPIDVDKYVALATENATLRGQLERMEEKLDEIISDDETEETVTGPETLGQAMNATLMSKLPAIVDLIIIKLMGGQADPSMVPANGISGFDESELLMEPSTKVLQEFRTIHPEIDTDLMRLLQLAKTQPDFFKMLIVQLRNIVK